MVESLPTVPRCSTCACKFEYEESSDDDDEYESESSCDIYVKLIAIHVPGFVFCILLART